MHAHPHAMTLAGSTLFWLDGARNLLDVADLVELEEGIRDMPFLIGYAGYLETAGVVTRISTTTREAADG